MTTKRTGFANDGALVPQIQRAQGGTEQRGALIPGIQKVPASPSPTQNSGGGNSSAGNSSVKGS